VHAGLEGSLEGGGNAFLGQRDGGTELARWSEKARKSERAGARESEKERGRKT
jgi:hypothetical protein